MVAFYLLNNFSRKERMFDSASLADIGFKGFIPLEAMNTKLIPSAPGVYGVLIPPDSRVAFAQQSRGGRFNGKDPSVPVERLKQEWVDGTDIVYIGKSRDLRKRIEDLTKFGSGLPVGHWGGRLMWQLDKRIPLSVAWMKTLSPAATETDLLDEFEARFDQLPFANLMRGSRKVPTLV